MLYLDFCPSNVGSPNRSLSPDTPPGSWGSGLGEKVFTPERASSGQLVKFCVSVSLLCTALRVFLTAQLLNRASQAEITTNMGCSKKLDFTVVAAAAAVRLNSAGPVTWGYVVCSFCLVEHVIGCWSRLAAATKRVLSVFTTITNSDCFISAIGCRGLCHSQTEGPHKKRKKGCFFTAPLTFIQPDNGV